jgi:hypothetical protein
MKYGPQTQAALDKLDVSLSKLRDIIKKGDIESALYFMEQGELKERFESLQNYITISQTGNIGARGTSQTGTF